MCMCAHVCVCTWMYVSDVSVRCDFLYICVCGDGGGGRGWSEVSEGVMHVCVCTCCSKLKQYCSTFDIKPFHIRHKTVPHST